MLVTKENKVISSYGIPNRGNTCYINTALQTLIQIFSEFFISGEYYKKLSSDDKVIDFMSDFAHLVASVQNVDGRWSKKHVNLYLNNVIEFLSEVEGFERFIKYQQADSYEFLSQILSLFSDYLSYKIYIEIDVKVDEQNLDIKDKTRLVFYKFLKKTLKKTSIIDEKLRGYFKTTITCAHMDCDYRSERFDMFLTLSLPMKGKNTLTECLEEYVKPITLDKDNMWYCEKCKRKSQAEKKMSIWTTGEYLIISYKRYMNMMVATIKDERPIESPFENLDMSPFVEDNKSNENIYDLDSITVHRGNMKNGHYIIARKIGEQWTVFNDSTVIPVKQEDINNHSAYYLVYKRR